MNTKIMEGLVGAKTNMNLLNTPFRIYKEARLKGDTATMERAMGYVGEFSDKADEYKAEAEEGMKEDAEEAREKAKSEREKAIQKRREEREKLEERIEKSKNENQDMDTVEVSADGKILLKENAVKDSDDSGTINPNHTASTNIKIEKETVIYTKTGEVNRPEQAAGISVSV